MAELDESEKEWEAVQAESSRDSKRGSRWQTVVMIVVALLVIVALIGLSQPVILRAAKATERSEAINFSYLAGQNTSENPGKVVLLAPMKIGTQEFWAKPFKGRAVLLRLDNSVEAPLIREADGQVTVGSGKTLFDTGDDTVWGEGFVFDLRHPEK